jgi:hypothetical protein
MKVIFLDIDGVLNYFDYNMEVDIKSFVNFKEIDTEKVLLLNEIVRRTGAKVVISSTWRKLYSIEELIEGLDERGFIGEIIDITPSLHHRNVQRGEEIKYWLDNCGLDIISIVILDDDSDMADMKQYHIKTSYSTGLTESDVDLAVNKLKEFYR